MVKVKGLRNQKPEKRVEAQVLYYLRARGWNMDVVESKAVFSKGAGKYIKGMATPGFSDLVGVCPGGRAAYIELKAPKSARTVRADQRLFLTRKIESEAFAAVIWSIEELERVMSGYAEAGNKQDYLKEQLLACRVV